MPYQRTKAKIEENYASAVLKTRIHLSASSNELFYYHEASLHVPNQFTQKAIAFWLVSTCFIKLISLLRNWHPCKGT